MGKLERLYDAFGEMLYVVAMADNIITKEETVALHSILKDHKWAKEIEWSFNYELEHHDNIDFLYKKVIDICYEFGPNPEYQYLIDIMEKVAKSGKGNHEKEEEIINKFTHDLMERFMRDLDKMEG